MSVGMKQNEGLNSVLGVFLVGTQTGSANICFNWISQIPKEHSGLIMIVAQKRTNIMKIFLAAVIFLLKYFYLRNSLKIKAEGGKM